ncbi:MAG: DUF763 domain-containing protein [Candidatus Micrarchaeaceae archaeon]
MHSATILPLHSGKAPRWLFMRMVKLGGEIATVIIEEFGPDELLRRLSDSNWFQALACTIGYDWHSSGTTTVTMAALKEALKEDKYLAIAGGKGKAGTNTPNDIVEQADRLSIPQRAQSCVDMSRLAAKVDGALVYYNISIYHHNFLFTKNGKWAVVQQAMQNDTGSAIRFQWLGEHIDEKDIANEPHSGIGTALRQTTLDLTANANTWARQGLAEATKEYDIVVNKFSYPKRHRIIKEIDIGKKGLEAIKRAGEAEPKDYKELLLVKGLGRRTVRSLALVASIIFDKELAYRDPVAFAYNVGGKDGIPFPVDKHAYDLLIEDMQLIIDKANVESHEKYGALKRLSDYINNRKSISGVADAK